MLQLHFGNEDYYFDTSNTYSPSVIRYVYGTDKDKEEKDTEWKTAQNFSDEDWDKFCEEEQLEDIPTNINGRYYYTNETSDYSWTGQNW